MTTRITAIALAITLAAIGWACDSEEGGPTGPTAVATQAPMNDTTSAAASRGDTTADQPPTGNAASDAGSARTTMTSSPQGTRGFTGQARGGWENAECAEVDVPGDPNHGYKFCIKSSGGTAELGWFASRGSQLRSRGITVFGDIMVDDLPQPKCHWTTDGLCGVMNPETRQAANLETSFDNGVYAIAKRIHRRDRPILSVDDRSGTQALALCSGRGDTCSADGIRLCTKAASQAECWNNRDPDGTERDEDGSDRWKPWILVGNWPGWNNKTKTAEQRLKRAYNTSIGTFDMRITRFTCNSDFDGVATFTGDATVRVDGTDHRRLEFTEADNVTFNCGA